MPPDILEFEEPIGVLLKEVEALTMLPRTDARDREIESLRRRIESVREQLYGSLTPYSRAVSGISCISPIAPLRDRARR